MNRVDGLQLEMSDELRLNLFTDVIYRNIYKHVYKHRVHAHTQISLLSAEIASKKWHSSSNECIQQADLGC